MGRGYTGGFVAEDKVSVIKRLGRSPDKADAVVMSWYRGSTGDWQRRMWGSPDPGSRPLPKVIHGHENKRRPH